MVPYGGFWWRVLAYIIDSIILNLATSLLGAVFGLEMYTWDAAREPGVVAAAGGGVLGLVITWLYSALMESSRLQATLGKLVVGLAVTDLHGDRIGFGRASGRFFAKILSAMILLIGFIMVAFTERKQGLHDLLAGTLVYRTRDPGRIVHDESIFA